jgi:elongation factor P
MADVTSTTDWKPGLTVELDGVPHVIVESHHVKPGKGPAYVRAKLKNLESGAQFERTFNAGQKVPAAMVERRDMQFLYEADGAYHLMDTESYEQTHIDGESIGDARRFLKENMVVVVTTNRGRVIAVELPTTVELEVTETEPGIRGDTVSGASKPAKLETGATVQVPLFVGTGDRIKVDTRSGTYLGRA